MRNNTATTIITTIANDDQSEVVNIRWRVRYGVDIIESV